MDLANLVFQGGPEWTLFVPQENIDDWIEDRTDSAYKRYFRLRPKTKPTLHSYFTDVAPFLTEQGTLGAMLFAPAKERGLIKAIGHLYPVPATACKPADYEKAMLALGPAAATLKGDVDVTPLQSKAGPFVRASARRTVSDPDSPVSEYEVTLFCWWFPDVEISMMLAFTLHDLDSADRYAADLTRLAASATRQQLPGQDGATPLSELPR